MADMTFSPSPSRTRQVVVVDGYGDVDVEQRILSAAGANVVLRPCNGDAMAVRTAVAGADGVLVRETPVDALAIAGLNDGAVIVRYGVGVDNIDRAKAASRRIYVGNVPDYGVEEVSDQALALLLAVTRRIAARDRAVRSGVWGVGAREPMHRIAGGTLGIIGYGRIGQAFHRKAQALGYAQTLIYDPSLGNAPQGARFAEIDEMCQLADAISLHAPLTEKTHHIIDARRLGLMKPTAVIVNTSRGGLIDQRAIEQALAAGKIFGAGLDVFEEEPPSPGSVLFTLDNVALSDHTGWYSQESVVDLRRKASEQVAAVFAGGRPGNWVNRWDDEQPANPAETTKETIRK